MQTEEYFKKYVSNTVAGTSNQKYFDCENGAVSFAFYRVLKSGRGEYSFLFTNTIDSTFGLNPPTCANDSCGDWEVNFAVVYTGRSVEEVLYGKMGGIPLRFDGKNKIKVTPDACFCSDGVLLDVPENGYIGIKMAFKGEKIPCHVENCIPTFRDDGDGMKPDKYVPLPSMVGISRKVKSNIVFWGDSITQGNGCPTDSYKHYTAICADILGTDYAFWNLGIGCGRATDAATDGAWAQKAKNGDMVVVCFGVNDLFATNDYDKITASYDRIINILKGKKVIFQTVPPFDFDGERGELYDRLNEYILHTLDKKVYAVFDNRPYLSDLKNPRVARFGGHPNEEGCRLWGEALAEFLKQML